MTTLLGLFGSPVQHSISPKMHNTAFQKLGMDWVYLPFSVDNHTIGSAVQAIKTLGMRGANVTMPCKSAVLPFVDRLTPVAKMAGAVNTIINEGGVLTGHNTDGVGYMDALREQGVQLGAKKMTVAGAGGAASAICIQAALDGVSEIAVFNRKDAFWHHAQQLMDTITHQTNCVVGLYDLADEQQLAHHIRESVVFANCTSVGMGQQQEQSVVTDGTMLRSDLVVTDVIYQPAKTKLLQMAEQQGCRILNGLGMLLYQGAAAFACWTGKDMPIADIQQVVYNQQNMHQSQ